MAGQETYDKLAILGLGHVGELVAFAATVTDRFKEIHLYNRDARLLKGRSKSDAKYRNLTDAGAWHDVNILRCSSYDDLPPDALTIICIKEEYDYRHMTGPRIREVSSRKDAPLMRKIGEAYSRKDFTGEMFVVSNPVGPMSHVLHHYSGIDESQIHPVGSILDLARFVKFIRHAIGDQEAAVDAMVAGEHGPSLVLLQSSSTVDGRPISLSQIDMASIRERVVQEGFAIVTTIGYSNAGIVASMLTLFDIVSSKDYPRRFPFGMKHNGVFVEVPVVKVDNNCRVLWEDFDDEERGLFEASVEKIAVDSNKILQDARERQQRRILIVDDEPGQPESLAASLEECILDDSTMRALNDFHFHVAHSGEDFIEAIKGDPTGYDLAIVDQRMPHVSGLEALVRAREYQPELDCMILSGKSEMRDLQEMVNHDRLAFVEKPFFDPTIRDLLGQPSYQRFKQILERTQQKIA